MSKSRQEEAHGDRTEKIAKTASDSMSATESLGRSETPLCIFVLKVGQGVYGKLRACVRACVR
eukprot:3573531-Amphidinium_carterae.1